MRILQVHNYIPSYCRSALFFLILVIPFVLYYYTSDIIASNHTLSLKLKLSFFHLNYINNTNICIPMKELLICSKLCMNRLTFPYIRCTFNEINDF